jgi:hypothetical protein
VFKRENHVFLPKYFGKHCAYPKDDATGRSFDKIIVPSGFIKNPNLFIGQGSHYMYVKLREDEDVIRHIAGKTYVPRLILAHLPLRSAAHAIAKAVTLAATSLCVPEKDRNPLNFLYRNVEFYELIKHQGYLTEKQVHAIAAERYGNIEGKNPEKILVDFTWDSDIVLQYTNYEESQNYLNPVFAHYEDIIKGFLENSV